ncbi:MAG: 2-oxo-4-hydroxy-4-carboxy-5-ureidoimidazoline decarboxylase [Limnohabitans sp.]|nr:2-oxo-4-hydroxy-4-carboxy-5-ureidoimidazoline decarboxylase [Limnohabitans sp.]
MSLSLQDVNQLPPHDAFERLSGLYEHSDWIIERALKQRPFASIAQFKFCMIEVVKNAGHDAQMTLIRAHPELVGKAMVNQNLTHESTNEQSKAGLTHCTAQEFARIQELNTQYNQKFGFPFILAVKGPRGNGLARQNIIDTFERRLHHPVDYEFEEALRNIHRIAEIRLHDKLSYQPAWGNRVWDWLEDLSKHSDPGFKEKGQLTVTYLTDAHRACARDIESLMRQNGFDEVAQDAVANVVGIYKADASIKNPQTLMTGSHYDTVRNGGKYDGRLGIYAPIACVAQLHEQKKRLPFAIEVVAFAEEEGQRYKTTFLGSGALVGQFNSQWLDQLDADGISMREALQNAGLDITEIAAIQRDPKKYLGFVEVHIEQGPVLNEKDLPLGVVTSINGSVRFVGHIKGTASHAGTTPMHRRRDAVCGLAELALYLEKRAQQDGDSVATIGQLQVPHGSINVVAGQCHFSLDMRAPNDAQRDALVNDVLQALETICTQRGLSYHVEETMHASCAPSDPLWKARWTQALSDAHIPLFELSSGAGHDAMKLHEVMPQAMLFVRGLNAGISHNPLESTTSDDIQLSIDALMQLIHLTEKNA